MSQTTMYTYGVDDAAAIVQDAVLSFYYLSSFEYPAMFQKKFAEWVTPNHIAEVTNVFNSNTSESCSQLESTKKSANALNDAYGIKVVMHGPKHGVYRIAGLLFTKHEGLSVFRLMG